MTNHEDEPIGSAVIGEAPQEGWTPVGDDEPLDLADPVQLDEVAPDPDDELRAAQSSFPCEPED